jgi:hypothetical protein
VADPDLLLVHAVDKPYSIALLGPLLVLAEDNVTMLHTTIIPDFLVPAEPESYDTCSQQGIPASTDGYVHPSTSL